MPWNEVWPIGTASVKANSPTGRQNTTYITDTQRINHYWNEGTISGKHRLIQFPQPLTGSPGTPGLEWAMYTKSVPPGVEIFYQRPEIAAGGPDIQMTVNMAAGVTGNRGSTFLPGGLIMNFGYIGNGTDLITSGQRVTYVTPYASKVYSIIITGQTDVSTDKTISVKYPPDVTAPNTVLNGFNLITSGSSRFFILSYMAIGI